MNCLEHAGRIPAPRSGVADIPGLIRALAEQYAIVLGNPERVSAICGEIERKLPAPFASSDIEHLSSLLPLLADHTGPLLLPVYELLERAAVACTDPWPLLRGMLAAREPLLVRRALECTVRCIEDGALRMDRGIIASIAARADDPGKPVWDRDCLNLAGKIVRSLRLPGLEPGDDPAAVLYLQDEDEHVRRLAASLLDMGGEPIPMERAAKALGDDAIGFLAPYLAYTRASHAEVLSLFSAPGVPPPVVPSLRLAQNEVGEHLLRRIIARVGWTKLNLHLELRHYVRVSPAGVFPFMVFPPEARLLRRCGEVGQAADVFVAVAHGGTLTEVEPATVDVDPASRFRNYNLVHAEVLADFLAVAPLSAERIQNILVRMDRIVAEFIGLFSSMSDECAILPAVYDGIKTQILSALGPLAGGEPLPSDLTRLTMMFEDPQALGQVRTLHGLKRYLHQQGLRLGFTLVQRSRSTNRTVTLVVCSRRRIIAAVEEIRYAEFEPEADGAVPRTRVPYAVGLVADGFARQLLYGHQSFPRVDIFCYGNEVHYYLTFRNHPAFLRINYAPPLQGGMIDLEYYGVSKYEMSEHPDASLSGLQCFFRSLGYHIQVENTRVHARYDKEHTPDLRSLCEKAELLFCLAPYLLDIDWTIGGLRLNAEARRMVAAAWAESFAAWGVLPLRLLLTKDQQGIIEAIAETPTGRREVVWSGEGAYRDRFTGGAEALFRRLVEETERLLPETTRVLTAAGRQIGQIHLERTLFLPLRGALARGEVRVTPRGYERSPRELFRRVSVPERFAELVAAGQEGMRAAAALAWLVGPLERFLTFRPAGTVGYCEVQSARLPLQDEDLGIHVMRGEGKNACLAFYTHGTVLYDRREGPADPWRGNALFDAPRLLSLLRRINYPVSGLEQLPHGLEEEAYRVRENLARALPAEPRRPIPGERAVGGLRAVPGRAVGRVVFGAKTRRPEDFTDAVLVTAALQPQDGILLYHAAGVISTGGGILSHAALLAAQFRKPAIVVAGHWESDPDRPTLLHVVSTEHALEEQEAHGYHIWTRTQLRERELVVREGDLVAMSAKEDVLRVLGQDPDTLALHDGFLQFARATHDLGQAAGDRDILTLRGRRIRAGHQIEKILARIGDPVLTCHALDQILEDAEGIGRTMSAEEKARLLALVLNNPRVATVAASHVRWLVRELRQQCEKAARDFQQRVPDSPSPYEVLSLRLDAQRAYQALHQASVAMQRCGGEETVADPSWVPTIDPIVRRRLTEIRHTLVTALGFAEFRPDDPRSRHLVRQWAKIDAVVGASDDEKRRLQDLEGRISRADYETRDALAGRSILWPADGGLELFPLIGWKAANLAEVSHIVGEPLVPPWFAISDATFKEILHSPLDRVLPGVTDVPAGASSLDEAIGRILVQPRLTHRHKAAAIRQLWESVVLPAAVVEGIVGAYRRLCERQAESRGAAEVGSGVLVALRSSSCEEDTETAARAGEFDTFLFVRGEKPLLTYLLRTWSGLWNERALHTRDLLGTSASCAGGGVIVQQIVDSRVSGVLQTINVARGEFREIVINAGWGLGEGIVSGTVAADQIIVSKEGDLVQGPLRFSYHTADKREAVVFNRRAGVGTIRCEAPYHKRLRPALEYTELCDLVGNAARLESVYGYPLDVEFGIEGSTLWILQVRPVTTSQAVLLETGRDYPLAPADAGTPVLEGG